MTKRTHGSVSARAATSARVVRCQGLTWAQALHPDLQRFTFGLSAVVDTAIRDPVCVVPAPTRATLATPASRPRARCESGGQYSLRRNRDHPSRSHRAPAADHLPRASTAAHRILVRTYRLDPARACRGRRAVFVPEGWHAWQQQIQGADELARNCGWASVVDHLCNLRLMALLAAAWRPGSSLWLYWSGPSLPRLGRDHPGRQPGELGSCRWRHRHRHWRRRGVPRDGRARITGGVAKLPVRAAITTLEPDASAAPR